jgi:5-methylcytosine-specific restriction endonuclease McrA
MFTPKSQSAKSEASSVTTRDGDAVLFNAGVRALGYFGFSDLEFDIGGKKSRRRYVKASSQKGERCSIWIKSTLPWIGMADVVRFPWSKRAIQRDDLDAVLFAVDDASRRGCTHLLGIVGNEITGKLLVARLYTLEEVRCVATHQKAACHHPFYIAHQSALIIRSHNEAFANAETIALTYGQDVLLPHKGVPASSSSPQVRSGPIYRRDTKVRDAALKLAGGNCERCGQQGFLTSTGELYLETHHVVGVAERGPDTIDNIIAICPNCHRQAHFAANRLQVERDFMEAIRRRGSKWRDGR